MADTEPDAHAVAARALHTLVPRHPAELLLADSSNARLDRRSGNALDAPQRCPVTSPFGCVAIRRGHPMVFDDSTALHACPKLQGRPQGPLSAACVPVTFMGRPLGVLHATSSPGAPPDDARLAGLRLLAGQVGSRIGNLRSFEQAQLQATTDALTGLLNRRAFETRARNLLDTGEPLSVVMADLDHFKLLNDTHGHEAGDRALRAFGQLLQTGLPLPTGTSSPDTSSLTTRPLTPPPLTARPVTASSPDDSSRDGLVP
ncbi:sensor domain-containing diguanylate cyclase [Dactylosporangium sp. NBC_01737]|uniref:GGDEF domain-containing protein n=1 Tax=Dactylosporangium sp. NBC_01737 TaxID=2975959 RepID=UPI003FA364EB